MKRAGVVSLARVLPAAAFASVGSLQNFPERPETSIPVWRFAVGFQVLGVAHEETCFSPDDDLGPVRGGGFAGGSPCLAAAGTAIGEARVSASVLLPVRLRRGSRPVPIMARATMP